MSLVDLNGPAIFIMVGCILEVSGNAIATAMGLLLNKMLLARDPSLCRAVLSHLHTLTWGLSATICFTPMRGLDCCLTLVGSTPGHAV